MSSIALIGKGNLGTHFAEKLKKSHQVAILNRSDLNPDIADSSFDYIFLCVPDDQLYELSQIIQASENTILVHTSGTKSISEIQHKNRAVIYPLQSFSKDRKVEMDNVPLYIEAEDRIKAEIEELARTISPIIHWTDSSKRLQLHLAAVFANNFSNHLLSISNQILQASEIAFADLKPLMIETVEKAFELAPENAQTGPAIRNDRKTIQRHLDLIPNEGWRSIYQLITADIRSSHEK